MKAALATPKKSKKMDEWEIQSCVDCLMRAEEIKADPEKMKQVMPHMKKKLTGMKSAISSLAELKAVRQEKNEKSDESKEDES